MIVFCDNDIILKLAAFDLLEDIALMSQHREVRVLDTLRHRLHQPRSWRKKYGSQTLDRALQFVESVETIDGQFSLPGAEALISAKYENEEGRECEIDGGELVLMSYAFQFTDALLMTGDKRCLFALGCHRFANEHSKAIHASLTQRVVCLETALLWSINYHGFENVRERIIPQLELNIDTALRVVFGSGLLSKEENVLAALESYITHLEKTVGENWLCRP